MRPIKFRAWDGDDKVMRSWKEIDFIKDTGDDYYMVGYKASPVLVKYDHIQIPMQYTGLKDKNDVEIYEGDIVNYFRKGISVIEWKNGGFIIKSETAGAYELLQNRIAEMEVIGNIYENKELLKELKH